MTTILDNPYVGTPQTHVFIVGIGTYHYLPGGNHHRHNYVGPDLDQLTSPPVSARAFADWFLSEFNNPTNALGIVELLLSESQSQPQSYKSPKNKDFNIEIAEINNIKAAFDRWVMRCNENPDNIAIFYFCGHGVMIQGDHILLAADCYQSPVRLYENAINFDKTYLGMASCRAKVQCFFIDSCRQQLIGQLQPQDAGAAVLITPRLDLQNKRDAPILNASIINASAYGLPNQVSRFTKALLQGFNGLGSIPNGSRWIVTTIDLASAVNKIITRLNIIDGGLPQQSTIAGDSWGISPIHVLKSPPKIPVVIELDPSQTMQEVDISLNSLMDPTIQYFHSSRSPTANCLELLEVIAGAYRLVGDFPSGFYKQLNESLLAMPPISKAPYFVEKKI